MNNKNILKNNRSLIITGLAILVVIIALLSTVYKDDLPTVYYSVLNGKSITVGDNQLTLGDPYFFLSDNQDIKNIGVSSKEYIKRSPIVVILPTRISITKMIELGKLVYKFDVFEYCKLYQFDDAEEFILFNKKTNIGYSINNEYKLLAEQESICNILN